MKRLVTQFDAGRARATVATPTCCCCCCCIASILTSTALTVLNAHELADRKQVSGDRYWGYLAWAVLAMPLAFAAGAGTVALFTLFADGLSGWAGMLVGVGSWAGLLTLLYQRLGQRRCGGVVALTVVVGYTLFAAEIYAGLALSELEGGGYTYLGLALVLPIPLVALMRRLTASGRR